MWLTRFLWLGARRDQNSLAGTRLQSHFDGVPKSDLLTASRKFPPTARADLQRALDESFAKFGARPLGLHQQFSHSGMTFADLFETGSRIRVFSAAAAGYRKIGQPQRLSRCASWPGDISVIIKVQ